MSLSASSFQGLDRFLQGCDHLLILSLLSIPMENRGHLQTSREWMHIRIGARSERTRKPSKGMTSGKLATNTYGRREKMEPQKRPEMLRTRLSVDSEPTRTWTGPIGRAESMRREESGMKLQDALFFRIRVRL